MITVCTLSNPFEGKRDIERVRWYEGVTARDVCPLPVKSNDASFRLRCTVDGDEIDENGWESPVSDGAFLEFARIPQGLTATVPFIGVELGGYSAALYLVGQQLALFYATQFVANALAPGREKPSGPDDNESQTYGFGGIDSNAAREGVALPVVYGEHAIAGPIINTYTRSTPDGTTLHVLMVLAGHQVYEIGGYTTDQDALTEDDDNLPAGLQVDNQPAENFRGVAAWLRMGTATQSPIPDLEYPRIQHTIQRVLAEPQDASTAEITPGTYDPDDGGAGETAIAQWTDPVGYTMGEDGDDFLAEKLFFPAGLFRLNSSAERKTETVEVQARYRRVDGSGVPFGDYVVMPKFAQVEAATQRPFSVEVGGRFYDPEDYTPPTGGQYLVLDSTNDYASFTGPADYSDQSASATEITVMAWVRVDWTISTGDGSGATPYQIAPTGFGSAGAKCYIAKQYDSANPQGFEFYLEDFEGNSKGSRYSTKNWGQYAAAVQRFGLGVRLGDGSTAITRSTSAGYKWRGLPYAMMPTKADLDAWTTGVLEGTWTLVAFSYKANDEDANGANTIEFLYNNGRKLGIANPEIDEDILWDSAEDILLGVDDTTPTTPFTGGDLDEVLFYQRKVGAIELASKYNGGAGAAGQNSEVGIVAGWHFDSDATDFVGTNDLTLNNGAALSGVVSDAVAPGGVVTGTALRDRFLVEFQRLTAPPDAEAYGDEIVLENVKLARYDSLNYAGRALLGLEIEASDQISGSRPLVRQTLKGALCNVWDGADEDHPTLTQTWTQNTAWVFADAATNTLYGQGRVFTTDRIDWPAVRDAALYYDEIVVDGPITAEVINWYADDTTDANYPRGQYQVNIAEADYPAHFPDQQLTVVPPDETVEWLRVTNVESGPSPSWLTDIEEITLQVALVEHIEASPARWQITFHPPQLPGVTGQTYSPNTGYSLAQRLERRMQFDGVFDRANFAVWDALQSIATSARSAPLMLGSKLSIFVDKAEDPSAMLTTANTVKNTVSHAWAPKATRPNYIEIQYLNAAENYEQRTYPLEHSTVGDPTLFDSYITRRKRVEGIVRETQVRRDALQDLNFFYLSQRSIQFRAPTDSLGFLPGDVVVVAADVPQWGFSGRLIEHSTSKATVYLDRDVTIAAATSYEVQVQCSETGYIETVAVDETTTGGAGLYPPGSRIALSASFKVAPKRGDRYSWGIVSRTTKQFKILSSRFDPQTKERTCIAIEYDEQVYDPTEFGTLPATSVSALASPTVGTIP